MKIPPDYYLENKLSLIAVTYRNRIEELVIGAETIWRQLHHHSPLYLDLQYTSAGKPKAHYIACTHQDRLESILSKQLNWSLFLPGQSFQAKLFLSGILLQFAFPELDSLSFMREDLSNMVTSQGFPEANLSSWQVSSFLKYPIALPPCKYSILRYHFVYLLFFF